MPYKKKYNKNYKKRTYRNNYKKIERIAQKVVNRNIETKEKRYDYTAIGIDPYAGGSVSFNSISYGGSAVVTALARGITAGTGEGNRVGHEILLRGIYINMAVQSGSGTEQNNLRFVLIRPKGTFTTTSIAALIQQIFSNQASGSTQWLQPIDTDFFNVYYDKILFLKPSDISGVGSAAQRFVKRFIKFPGQGIRLKWNESDSQPDRDFLLVGISDSAVVSHPGAVAGFVRLYYKDA